METSIKDFIQKTIEEIQNGLPDGYDICDEIEFNISIITTTNKKGGLNIKIASGEIDKEKQTVHSINFGVINPKKQQQSMHQNARAIISYVKQGISELASISAELNSQTSVPQETNKEIAQNKGTKKRS